MAGNARSGRQPGWVPADDARCTSISKTTGDRCRANARPGLRVCKFHGGATKAGNRIVAETQLIRAMKYATGMIDEDDLAANPITGLQLELRRTAWNILSLEQQLADLTGEDLIWGKTFSEQKLGLGTGPGNDSYEMERDEAKINGYVQLYLKEREHYSRICQLAINADLDTRIVNNATRHSETLYKAVMAGMQAAGLTSEQREAAMVAMSRELRTSPIELVEKGG